MVVAKSSISAGLLCPPLGLAYIAGCAREAGFDVQIIDPVGEDPFETNPIDATSEKTGEPLPLMTYGWSLPKIVAAFPQDTQYIGLSCTFSHEWPVSKMLARMLRERFPKAVIVAGGEHITAAPEFSALDCPQIDYLALGEGEETLVELLIALEQGGEVSEVAGLVYLENGKPKTTKTRNRIRSVDQIPWPAWDLVPMDNYLDNFLSYGVTQSRTMPIMATRGCPYQCTFCSSPSMWTTRWFTRDPVDVADEIQSYQRKYNASNFDFYDLTAIVKKSWIIDFCQILIDRKMNIEWQLPAGTRSEAIDAEVAELLAKSGHRNLVYAPETGSERMLKIIKKRVSLPAMYDSMQSSIDNGISVKLNMIIGFPEEKVEDLIETYKLLIRTARLGIDDATLATFSPYPGSQMFTDLQNSGEIGQLSDEFFYNLALMGDIRSAVSFAKNFSGRQLLAAKLFGIALFYMASYAYRPQRVARTFVNLYGGKHETRIEKSLSAFVDKIRRARAIA